MDALADAADLCLTPVWWLANTGFIAKFENRPTYVRGVESPDEAYQLTETVVTALLVPARRRMFDSDDALTTAALEEARKTLFRHAVYNGRITTIIEPQEAATVPSGTPDLDAVLSADGALAEPDKHHFRLSKQVAAVALCAHTVAGMDDRSRQLVALRWGQGQTALEVAQVFTCGAAAVSAHERRVRRQISQAWRKAHPDVSFGPTAMDRVLAGAPDAAELPAISRERLRRDILKRTFQSEPPPFSVRLSWALGAAALAFALWLLMFLRVLPYYGDDVYPAPLIDVACEGPCSAGRPSQIDIRAPQDTRFAALWLTGIDGQLRPLLTAPGGGVFRLPLGARGHRVALPYPVEWPEDLAGTATVTAIFTDRRIPSSELRAIAAGDLAGTVTSTHVRLNAL
ncbi:MAG: hypothetical protein AAF449_09645 [Myxococcota bacterium]